MNMKNPISISIAALLCIFGFCRDVKAHEHIAAGSFDGSHLAFVSGSILPTYHLVANPAKYGGLFSLDENARTLFPLDGFTFIVLSDGQTDDAQPYHAATGTDVWLQITSVTGPSGATFGFWEADWSDTHTTPTKSFLTNTPTGDFKFELSEPLYFIDPEDQDPYGHIHGRAWTVDQPGDYYVGFTLYDLSTVGPDGGPLYQPSETYTLHFVAVPEPGSSFLLMCGGVGAFAFYRPWRIRTARK